MSDVVQDFPILCLSSQSWDDGMWTNKQHIMSRLAKQQPVFHIDFGLRTVPHYLWKKITQDPSSITSPGKLFTNGILTQKTENLFVGDSYNPFWVGALSRQNRIRDFFTYDFKIKLCLPSIQQTYSKKPITWVYHPGYAEAVQHLDDRLLVYDCVDNYAAFPNYRADRDWLTARERKLCRNADLVFTTSQALYDDKIKYNPENTHLVHNVGDAPHFKQSLNDSLGVPAELKDLDSPILGFVGAVSDYKLNSEWLVQTAKAKPEWNIVVIGPVGKADPETDIGQMQNLSNIHLLGHRPYDELPAYHKGFDVGIIPYRINDYTESVFPIKFFEFLATGNPVVISKLPALTEFYDAVRVADDADGFIELCEDALNNDSSEQRQSRIELAENNSWESRIDTLTSHIQQKLD